MITPYVQKLRSFNRNVRLSMVSSALFGFSIMGMFGVLIGLYLLRLGYGPDAVGLVYSMGSVMMAVFSLPAGALGRRWGIRRTMIVGMSLIAGGATLLPFGAFWSMARQPRWILAAIKTILLS